MKSEKPGLTSRILGPLTFCSLLASLPATALAQTKPESRFVIQGDTVLDARSRLTWQRCSVGQQWNGSRCSGEIRLMNAFEARLLVNYDWRLPSKSELEQLVDQARKQKNQAPFIDIAAFPDMNMNTLVYWTSSKGATGCFAAGFGEDSKSAGFNDGFSFCIIQGAVRLVKGKLKPKGPWAE